MLFYIVLDRKLFKTLHMWNTHLGLGSFSSSIACTKCFSYTLSVLNLIQNTCYWSVNMCILVVQVTFCVTQNANANWLPAFNNAPICYGIIWKTWLDIHQLFGSSNGMGSSILLMPLPTLLYKVSLWTKHHCQHSIPNWWYGGCHQQLWWPIKKPKHFAPSSTITIVYLAGSVSKGLVTVLADL